MPQPVEGARGAPGSRNPANRPQESAPNSPQFTESPQYFRSQPTSEAGNSPDQSADWLSLDATEPFPPGIFRVPVPDEVFRVLPNLSDSALRSLLGLIHLSFRFEPTEEKWTHPGDWFSRSEVQEAAGLSGQGTRNGLSELESKGWITTDREGRGHLHRLLLEVPERRYTYLPTTLLEEASSIGGTELRVILAVLRGTWGWTQTLEDENGKTQTVHDRWDRKSNQNLSEVTGRSETAVKEAARALQGKWIERVRVGSGPYQYRFLPEAVGDGSGDESSFSGSIPNDLTPDPQQSDPPSSSIESFSNRHHPNRENRSAEDPATEEPDSALPENPDPPEKEEASNQQTTEETPSSRESSSLDDENLTPDQTKVAEKLSNVGIWKDRIAEVIEKYSLDRIRANFQLYRERSSQQEIQSPGGWLYRAIVEGYVIPNPTPERTSEDRLGPSETEPSPELEHQEVVSESEKEFHVSRGVAEEQFHRCLSREGRAEEARYMYFDPEVGGPKRRV